MPRNKNESAIEYMRRVVNNLSYEPESMLEELPSIEALVDYYELWSIYDADYWEGICDCIAMGDDPAPAKKFIEKYNLKWTI